MGGIKNKWYVYMICVYRLCLNACPGVPRGLFLFQALQPWPSTRICSRGKSRPSMYCYKSHLKCELSLVIFHHHYPGPNCVITLKFDWYLDSCAAKMPVKCQSNMSMQIPKLAVSRHKEFWWSDIILLRDSGPGQTLLNDYLSPHRMSDSALARVHCEILGRICCGRDL